MDSCDITSYWHGGILLCLPESWVSRQGLWVLLASHHLWQQRDKIHVLSKLLRVKSKSILHPPHLLSLPDSACGIAHVCSFLQSLTLTSVVLLLILIAAFPQKCHHCPPLSSPPISRIIPCFRDSVLPCFRVSVLPCFRASVFPCCHASVLLC